MSQLIQLIQDFTISYAQQFFRTQISSFHPAMEKFENTVNENEPFGIPLKIGEAPLEDGNELLVFTCNYKKGLTERSAKKQQFEIAKKVLKEDFKDGAIFIFYDEDGCFRFSFIRRFYGEEQQYSNWKRFTYFVNPKEANKTFKDRIGHCSFKTLDAIQDAFSVEKLTKEFYNKLFNWYQ